MANQIIQNYLNDESIDESLRQNAWDDINAGISQDEIAKAITLKYGGVHSPVVEPSFAEQAFGTPKDFKPTSITEALVGPQVERIKTEPSPTSLSGRIESAKAGRGQALEAGIERFKGGITNETPETFGEFISDVALPSTGGIVEGTVGQISGALGGFFKPEAENLSKNLGEVAGDFGKLVPDPVKEEAGEAAQKILDLIPEERKRDAENILKTLGVFEVVPVGALGSKAASAGIKGAIDVVQELPNVARGVKSIAETGAKGVSEINTARRLNKLANAEDKLDKFTTEVLQTPVGDLNKTEIGIAPRGVQEAAKVIKKSKSIKEVDTQLKTVGGEAINKVNAKISRNADLPVSTDDVLDPLRRKIAELERDPTKDKVTKKYKDLLSAEESRIDGIGGTQNLGETQARKIQLNEDLSTFFNRRKDPTDLEIADAQARDLLREGYMTSIEKVAGKDVGSLNRTFAGLSDARSWLRAVDSRFERQITPTFIQSVIQRIPIVKGLLKGTPDAIIGTRSSNLLDILPQRTKDIENLRGTIDKLKGKLNSSNPKQ